MRLVSVHARFFRSLNFDFVRRSSPSYRPMPWDATPSGVNYPFVELSLDPSITTVVGANEAGKSQVLAAIKFALTGKGMKRQDFCRYSPLFLTDKTLHLPEFGVIFDEINEGDIPALNEALGTAPDAVPDKIALFRMNESPKLRMYLLIDQIWQQHTVTKPTALAALGLPSFFEIDAKTPLPDAVPIEFLTTGNIRDAVGRDSLRSRWDEIEDNRGTWFATKETVAAASERLFSLFSASTTTSPELEAKYRLAEALLLEVAGLERALFDELKTAIREGKAGYAKSIVDTINLELARALNFRHWWRQDDHFELFVEYQEYDLTFMIRDRTGRTYSFDERSGGLKYFLSYFVQYLSHSPEFAGRPEMLLMDEPDAYLSSSGQQDLLKIFEAFAFPDTDDRDPVQVVYVTHSPFLIDKNHSERIRVLEKGRNDEGTRVVTNASRNHYEPLRSAIGEFVAETTFMGSCNLILEGASDQVLLAGMATWLRKEGVPDSRNLDLNAITMVPAGSAGHVPYMAFLARGRDVDKPAVIVLLDGDKAGDDAVRALRKGGPRGKQVIPPELVLQLTSASLQGVSTENPTGVAGIEDLVPLEIAVQAAKAYIDEFVPEVELSNFVAAPEEIYGNGKDTLAGLVSSIGTHVSDEKFHIDKIGFARHVVNIVSQGGAGEASALTLSKNFQILLKNLAELQRDALRRQSDELIRDRINRIRDRFATDHPASIRKEDVLVLIEEVDSQLDSSQEAEDARMEMRSWVRIFKLEDDPRSFVDDHGKFLDSLTSLAYLSTRKAQGE